MKAPVPFEQWWEIFYGQIDAATVDRSTARLVYEYMTAPRPQPEALDDWAEPALRVRQALHEMTEAANSHDLRVAERHAMAVREAACKLCCWFNERAYS